MILTSREIKTRKRIEQYMKDFFKNKKSARTGRRLKKDDIATPEYIELILHSNLENVFDYIDPVLDCSLPPHWVTFHDDADAEWSCQLVSHIIQRLCAARIPKEYQAGFLVICLEQCYGYSILEYRQSAA